ncbi:flagellar hook-basal body complex protein FliE [Pseudacidovorax sp. 1753]|uniref:flagellar hook-basal body complex protein FliE n=1 Tax=Pseudacidovorax sp. 1753 TaxID=3156419 RepID=UPI00339656D6
MTTFLPVEALSALSPQAQSMVAQLQAGALAPTSASVVSGPLPIDQSARLGTTNFAQMVSAGLSEVNKKIIDGEVGLQKLALGEAQNLHQLMINLEESRLSFQVLMQVRGRLLEAYQDVMKMPI